MKKPVKRWALPAALGGGALVLVLLYVLFLRPYLAAATAMPQDTLLSLEEREDGRLVLSWPAAEGADAYLAEALDPDAGEKEAEPLWSETVAGTSCELPEGLNGSRGVALRVTSEKRYRIPLGEKSRMGDDPLSGLWSGRLPEPGELKADIDADDDVLTLTWDGESGGLYTVCDESGNIVRAESGENRAVLAFRDGGDMPAIGKGERCTLLLYAGRTENNLVVRSRAARSITVDGEDFLGTVLKLEMTEDGDNFYTFRWNETKGEHYELQEETASGQWETLESFTDEEPLECVVGPLASFSDHTYRIVSLGGHTLPGSEFAATPAEVSFTTGATTRYATIWPLKDLDIYADTARSSVVGKAGTDKSYCVMGESEGMFLIYFDGGKGYIDSTYCLINLPDYLGELCAYDITNSYDAIYEVHDYGIPEITGTVVTGYEEVASGYVTDTVRHTVREDPQPESPPESYDAADRFVTDENGIVTELWSGDLHYRTESMEVQRPTRFLVPLLYPTAQKVAKAAQAAQQEGYRLKIYDAYRPWIATRFLYDKTASLLNAEIPEYIYAEMAGDAWEDYVQAVLYPPEPEEPEEPEVPDEAETTDGATEGTDTTEGTDAAEGTDAPTDGETPEDAAASENPESAEGQDTADTSGEAAGDGTEAGPSEEEPVEEPEPERPRRMSVYTLMTNGSYSLGAFLARSGSMHNLGIAVDLTLETLDRGRELTMQTAMHDLSWYSVLTRNNDNADLLAKFMTGCGLAPLTSEWWHFQDDELRASAELVTRQQGVTRAGWRADNQGWRYRTSEGEFLRDGTYTVDGRRYTFDENGYSDYAAWEQR